MSDDRVFLRVEFCGLLDVFFGEGFAIRDDGVGASSASRVSEQARQMSAPSSGLAKPKACPPASGVPPISHAGSLEPHFDDT